MPNISVTKYDMLSLEFHPSYKAEVRELYKDWSILSEGVQRNGITNVNANVYTMLIIKERTDESVSCGTTD